MKTKQEIIKAKYDKKLETKKGWVKTVTKPLYAMAASGEYVWSSINKGKEEEKVEPLKTEKIQQSKVEKTIELTSEVDINSLDIFADAVNESSKETTPKQKEVKGDDFFDTHSYVQQPKDKKTDFVSEEEYKKSQEEKLRLQNIKERIIKSKQIDESQKLEFQLDKEAKMKQLLNLGNISPTKGTTPKVEEEVTNKETESGTIEFLVNENDSNSEEYISIDQIVEDGSEPVHTNTSPESTIEQIVKQALIMEEEDGESFSTLLIEDLILDGTTVEELTKEIQNLKDEDVEKTIELQLAISTTSSIQDAQEKTDFEIKEEDITPEETTEQEIKIEELSAQDLLRVQRTEGTTEAQYIAEQIYKETPEEEIVEEIEEEIVEEVVEEKPTPKVEEPEEDLGTNVKPEKWCKGYKKPSKNLLRDIEHEGYDKAALKMEADSKSDTINELFNNFNIGAKVIGYEIGPTVTTYQIEVSAGTKITKITKLEDNIKMELQAKDIRIQAPIPGKPYVGIEVPNNIRKIVSFKETVKQVKDEDAELLIVAGQDTVGNVITFDLASTPHMLIAGSTGSGKSVAINTIITSLLMKYSPEEVKMILVDPKMVEFTPYHNIPHLITPVITSPGDANLALKQAVNEMERRYRMMAENGARNIKELNAKLEEKLPYIVIVIDELADLMMVAAKEVEESIMRITQKARAAGIHMIVATQRPSTDIITGVIKSNIPSRIAFTVSSSIDSRTILDQVGAEKLIGHGDMLISLYGQLPYRGQGSYISVEEVDDITNMIKKQCTPFYEIEVKEEPIPGVGGPLVDEDDPLYQAAKKIVIQQRKASTSLIQRYLSVGYNKAANIIEALEANGVVGPANGSKPREVLVSEED